MNNCQQAVNPESCYSQFYSWHDWSWWLHTHEGLFALVGIGLIVFFLVYPLIGLTRDYFWIRRNRGSKGT